MVKHRIVISGSQIVEILHGGDRDGESSLFQLIDGDFREADMSDLPLGSELCESTLLRPPCSIRLFRFDRGNELVIHAITARPQMLDLLP